MNQTFAFVLMIGLSALEASSGSKSVIHVIKSKLGELQKSAEQFCNLFKGFPLHPKTGCTSGAVYIRWGRRTCSDNDTQLMYSGYVGGSHYSTGGASNLLCLPQDPTWRKYKDGHQPWKGRIYGSEYEPEGSGIFNSKLLNHEVPCAVCQSMARSQVYMIPGRDICYRDWHLEYRGYLVSDRYNRNASEFVCLDADPETTTSSNNKNNDGRLFYPVEAMCGSLKCPPYVDGRELTCAVCSR